MKHFVAKLVKSFGSLGDAAESLDDFRYTKAFIKMEKTVHGVVLCIGTTAATIFLRSIFLPTFWKRAFVAALCLYLA